MKSTAKEATPAETLQMTHSSREEASGKEQEVGGVVEVVVDLSPLTPEMADLYTVISWVTALPVPLPPCLPLCWLLSCSL